MDRVVKLNKFDIDYLDCIRKFLVDNGLCTDATDSAIISLVFSSFYDLYISEDVSDPWS